MSTTDLWPNRSRPVTTGHPFLVRDEWCSPSTWSSVGIRNEWSCTATRPYVLMSCKVQLCLTMDRYVCRSCVNLCWVFSFWVYSYVTFVRKFYDFIIFPWPRFRGFGFQMFYPVAFFYFFRLKSGWSLKINTWARKVAGSIPDAVIGIFHWVNSYGRSMALESSLPLTQMRTRDISWG